MNIFFLHDSSNPQISPSSFGTKAYNLHLLAQRHPLNVPKGFCLPSHFSFDLSVENLKEHSEINENISRAIEKIGGFPVAIRSSSSLEDLEGASFAGMYETVLHVSSLDSFWDCYKKCQNSFDSERVKSYKHSHNIPKEESAQGAILIQKMISPSYSGVLFTLNPLSGKEEEFLLEYTQEETAEKLVSGHMTPKSALLSYEDMGHPLWGDLIEKACFLQRFFECPQDIEWAIENKNSIYPPHTWILQARPITTISPRRDVPELTDADFKDGGISAGVCTPFLYSLYDRAFGQSMARYFYTLTLLSFEEAYKNTKWIYSFYGRGQWNAQAVKEALSCLPFFEEKSFDANLGIKKNYENSSFQKKKNGKSSWLKAFQVFFALQKEYRECLKQRFKMKIFFEKKNQDFLSFFPLKNLSDKDFLTFFKEILEFQKTTETFYFRFIYNSTNFQSDFKDFLKKKFGNNSDLFLYFISCSEEKTHTQITHDLELLAKEFKETGLNSHSYQELKKKFLESHYHHAPRELDLTIPRWGENPEMIDEMVLNFSSNETKKQKLHISQKRPTILENLSWTTRKKLNKFHQKSLLFLQEREVFRCFSTKAYYLVRQGLLEYAKRKNISKEDIFFYHVDEIIEELILSKESLEKRKFFYYGYKKFKAPHEFGGEIYNSSTSSSSSSSSSTFETKLQFTGIGCSLGTVEAKARVIRKIEEANLLQEGEILITQFTDPGWTPCLYKAAGIVTEVGGVLSHAAIIGREFGIPTVLNVAFATEKIKTGDQIRIKGGEGIVEILT